MKYDGRAVWKPAAVMESVARTALRRSSTAYSQLWRLLLSPATYACALSVSLCLE